MFPNSDDFVSLSVGLPAIEAALSATMARLRFLVDRPLNDEALIEITAIYNNVAYLFLYLEANSETTKYESLLPWRQAFHDDRELRVAILGRLRQLRCADSEVEESRRAYVTQLEEAERHRDASFDQRSAELLAQAKCVTERLRAAETELLLRIGADRQHSKPAAVLYGILASTDRAATREKLVSAWRAVRGGPLRELETLVDAMVEVRRARAHRLGLEFVADEAFARCGIARPEVEDFLGKYLASAARRYDEFAVASGTSPGDDIAPHFPNYLAKGADRGPAPSFDLVRCLRHIFRVTEAILGLTCELHEEGAVEGALVVDVHRANRRVGRIHLALWNQQFAASGNHTLGLRNRTDWESMTQLPVAHVFCGFTTKRDGGITYQNVHSLFHEFGHAINHLLVRKRISNRAGLEYLPLERLEFLSMWFERWAYHLELASAVSSAEPAACLAACRRTKALEFERTFMERGIVSAVDLEVHSSAEGGIRAAFDRVAARHGLAQRVALDDILEYFAWPMFQAHPGANFTYLWGAAYSAALFEPLESSAIGQPASPNHATALAPCFDFDLETPPLSCDALTRFYRHLSSSDERGPIPSH